MKKPKNVVAVLPAYQASKTLVPFLKTLPKGIFSQIILVDDASTDGTYALAKRQQGIKVYRNLKNLGYGGNMKRCLNLALKSGAQVVVEIHPDGEYLPDGIIPALNQINKGSHFVLGYRFKSILEALNAGMHFYKYPINQALTWFDNLILGTEILDMHQGFRVYSKKLLDQVDFAKNSNDYLFTFQIITQAVDLGLKIDNVPVSTYYRGKKRGVNFRSGVKYCVGTFIVLGQFGLKKMGFIVGFLSH